MTVLGNRTPSRNPSASGNEIELFSACPKFGGKYIRDEKAGGDATYSDFLPPPEVEKDVAALLTFGVGAVGLGKGRVFGEPHLDAFVEAPIAVVSAE